MSAALAEATNELAQWTPAHPVTLLTDAGRFGAFYDSIIRDVEAFQPDTTTEAGRKEIASLAYKIARSKTAIDEAGKALNEDARKRINTVDEARRAVRTRLDKLRDQVRAPLTAWELEEEARVERIRSSIERLANAGVIRADDTSATVAARLAETQAVTLTEADYGDLHLAAVSARDSAIAILTGTRDRMTREEADRAELAILRAAAAKRAEDDRAADIAARRERDQLERAAAEAERLETALAEAAAAATRQAERQAAEAAAAAIAAEERRAANTRHRAKVVRAATEAIAVRAGIAGEVATIVVNAIIAGDVPGVSLRF